MSAEAIFIQEAVKKGNAVIDVTIGGVEYIAEGRPSSSPTDAKWRCMAIFPLENGGKFIKHAAGLNAPGWNGELMPALTYIPEEA